MGSPGPPALPPPPLSSPWPWPWPWPCPPPAPGSPLKQASCQGSLMDCQGQARGRAFRTRDPKSPRVAPLAFLSSPGPFRPSLGPPLDSMAVHQGKPFNSESDVKKKRTQHVRSFGPQGSHEEEHGGARRSQEEPGGAMRP